LIDLIPRDPVSAPTRRALGALSLGYFLREARLPGDGITWSAAVRAITVRAANHCRHAHHRPSNEFQSHQYFDVSKYAAKLVKAVD